MDNVIDSGKKMVENLGWNQDLLTYFYQGCKVIILKVKMK